MGWCRFSASKGILKKKTIYILYIYIFIKNIYYIYIIHFLKGVNRKSSKWYQPTKSELRIKNIWGMYIFATLIATILPFDFQNKIKIYHIIIYYKKILL